MREALNFIETHFHTVIEFLVLAVELIGVCLLVWATVRALSKLIRHKGNVKLDLAEGIGLALEFKMVGELLKTVTAHELDELWVLGIVIILRASIAFLVHWEIKNEKESQQSKDVPQDKEGGQ